MLSSKYVLPGNSYVIKRVNENMNLGMYGYYYQPRNNIRLKNEQREFCVNAECMETMIEWSDPFQCNTFIDSLEDKMISLKGQFRKKNKTT